MANTRAGNVICVDTTDTTLSGYHKICGIRYEAGNTAPAVTLKKRNSSGNVLYSNDSATDTFEQVKIEAPHGIHVTLAGSGTKVYLYLK